MTNIFETARNAEDAHNLSAQFAFETFRGYCNGRLPPRVPGMDTFTRLAIRIANGKTAEEAAAAEYVYRWHLAIKAPDQCGATGGRDWRDRRSDACVPIFGTPHLVGM